MSKKKKNIVQKFYLHQRKWFAKWHTAAGIIAGCVLIIVSLTGSLLVFEQELDVWLNPTLFEYDKKANKKYLSYQEMYDIAKVKFKDKKIQRISQDERYNHVYFVGLYADKAQYIFNPYNGDLLGKRVYNSSLMGTIRMLHRTLLIPIWGKYLVGVSALMCLVLVITGIRQWIPKKWKDLKRSLGIKTNAKAKRVNCDLHNTLGFYFSPFISIISATGVAITFSQIIVLLLFLLSFEPPKSIAEVLGQKSEYQENTDLASITQLTKEVKKLKPEAAIRNFQFPNDSIGTITVNVTEPSKYSQTGHNIRMSFDQYSGKLIFDTDTDVPKTGRVYLDWLTPLHFGTFGGITTQIIALLTCLITAMLFVTGLIMWIPRWKHNRKKSRKTPETEKLIKTEKV